MAACVCFYLEVPNGHCSIDSCGAELATIPFVSFIDRHLAKEHIQLSEKVEAPRMIMVCLT